METTQKRFLRPLSPHIVGAVGQHYRSSRATPRLAPRNLMSKDALRKHMFLLYLFYLFIYLFIYLS